MEKQKSPVVSGVAGLGPLVVVRVVVVIVVTVVVVSVLVVVGSGTQLSAWEEQIGLPMPALPTCPWRLCTISSCQTPSLISDQ
mmetsp:Transcript_23936/g.60494  ORF Transcript_23936/g.60494 Transcript_23936/m.60494 type:complete len:83 (-) Transcript_23936:934-1182(-)